MLSQREKLHLNIFVSSCLLAMIGFFLSRFLLSISIVMLVINALLQDDLKARFRLISAQPFFWIMAALFFTAFVSGIWSKDKSDWLRACSIKLPLFLLPTVFAMQKGLIERLFIRLSVVWIILSFLGSCWTMLQYMQSKIIYDISYSASKVLPTWAGDSHIRFSIAVIIAILLWLQMEWGKLPSNQLSRWALRIIMIWLMLFLLILSSKTGWIGLFMVILPLCLYHLYRNGYMKSAVALIVLMLTLPLAAYKAIPTLRGRVNYIKYQLEHYDETRFSGVYSDQNRVLSLKAGWDLFLEHWLVGTGYGDLKYEMNRWFEINAPYVPVSERFRPLNQWLSYGAATGIIGMLLVTAILLLPFFNKNWQDYQTALAFAVFMMLLFLYEGMLDDQLGVFLFTFFTLWWNFLCEHRWISSRTQPELSTT